MTYCVGLYVIEYMPVPHVTIFCTCMLCFDDELIMLKIFCSVPFLYAKEMFCHNVK